MRLPQILIVLYKPKYKFRSFKTSKLSALENTYGAAAFIQPRGVCCRIRTVCSCPKGDYSLIGHTKDSASNKKPKAVHKKGQVTGAENQLPIKLLEEGENLKVQSQSQGWA